MPGKLQDETTNLRVFASGRRARVFGGGVAFGGRLRLSPLPDFPRVAPWRMVPTIAQTVGCNEQTVRNVLHAFNATGLGSMMRRSSVAHALPRAFDPDQAARLRALLHQSPRLFGQETSVWTLPLVARVCFAQGITPTLVSGEKVRTTLERLGVLWRRAKNWITNPDPEYNRKKCPRPSDAPSARTP